MPSIVINVGLVGGKQIVLSSALDPENIDPAKLEVWTVESKTVTARTLIDTVDKAGDASSPVYGLKYNLAFAEVHGVSITKPDKSVIDKLSADVWGDEIPAHILNAYVYRADVTRGCSDVEFDSLKKPVSADASN